MTRREIAAAESISAMDASATEQSRTDSRSELLREFTELLVPSAGEQALLDKTVRWVATILRTDACKILQVVEGEHTCMVRAGIGWAPKVVGLHRIPISPFSVAGYALITSRGPIVLEHLRPTGYFRDATLLLEHGFVSGIASPIGRGVDAPFGVLSVHMRTRRVFSAEEGQLVMQVADTLFSVLQACEVERARRATIANAALHEG